MKKLLLSFALIVACGATTMVSAQTETKEKPKKECCKEKKQERTKEKKEKAESCSKKQECTKDKKECSKK